MSEQNSSLPDLNVTLVQTNIYWEDATANRAMLEEKIFSISTPTDLIILPEMFTTGFTMNPAKVAEPMNLHTTRWMKQMAAQTGAVITGSVVIKEDNSYFNRLLWVSPNGEVDFYDKRHLFRMGKEHEVFTGGNKKIIKALKGWKICPLICYDLRFPVWSRNADLAYDLLIYVANWPQIRMYPWDSLLVARAIENQSYVIGVNRTGLDGNNIVHAGHSAIIDFAGKVLYREINSEVVHQHIISKTALDEFRQKFPAYLDADSFEIN
ncbi:amidohydrolase [Emticicia agri]|uniref:Omega-amidase YafV n=1 Tax=Emticicia agri TaxID=2492393 RepID=A0A4Q5LYH9_9BACT|nr:amidohydrolase [Emticicia agri]RYU94705.1 amidohydrolase [Emticicia agri]